MYVDFKDFNRLSRQSDEVVSLLCQYLFCNGGIIVDALEEFKVVPVAHELSVRVKPGVAILPSGQAVCLNEETLLNLSQYQNLADGEELIVSLGHSVYGTDSYTDPEDSSITGYRTEVIKPEFIYSTKKQKNTLEVFRVKLNSKTRSLRVSEASEGWSGGALKSADSNVAVIDNRYRSLIVPQTYLPVSLEEFTEFRKTLYTLENQIKKIAHLYHVSDPHQSLLYVVQTHAEALSRPFQPLKISYLLAEASDRLCLYFEKLAYEYAGNNAFSKVLLVEVIELLSCYRAKELLPNFKSLEKFNKAIALLNEFIDFGVKNYSTLSTLEESLLDRSHQKFEFENNLLMAGGIYEKVDELSQKTSDKWFVKAKDFQPRLVCSEYTNGDYLEMPGIFFNTGTLNSEIQIRYPEKMAVIVLHQYVRRGEGVIHYELNGKPLKNLELKGTKNNHWVNLSLIVPEGMLVSGKNHLKIVVEKSDLDFGFFDLAVYQPKQQ
jgi:hypothetical protein